MLSGSTALTVALVPTATKAGVRIGPCGVVITPVRPSRPGSRLCTAKPNPLTPSAGEGVPQPAEHTSAVLLHRALRAALLAQVRQLAQ